MSPTTVIDNNHITLLYYPEEKIVHHIFHQPTTGRDFRDFLNRGTELLRDNHAEKWLSDDRENMSLTPEDRAWGSDVWIPQTIAVGWKYWALVVPQDTSAQMSLIIVVQELAKLGLQIRVFTEPDIAMEWLNTI